MWAWAGNASNHWRIGGAIYRTQRAAFEVAIGAIFFFQMVGIAISPAILGFAQTIVSDLESGLKFVFLLSAIALTTALLLIVTIHEMLLDTEAVQEGERSKSAVLNETSPS